MQEATEQPRADTARRRRRDDHGVLLAALLVSAIVHAFVFFGLSFDIELVPRVSSAPVIPIIRVAPAMQAFDLVEVAGDAAPIEVRILDRSELRPAPARITAPRTPSRETGERVAVPEPVDPMSVRDRLRYRMTTPQVWRPPTEEVAVEETPQDIVKQRIASELAVYNDSVAAENAAAARALDWTKTDANGNRWGVSPGAIHLGSITIPVGNTQFAVAPGRREEFAGRVRTWNEIQDQAVREEARSTFKDRVKAIEERKAKERAERNGVAPARRDTTTIGGN